MSKKDRLTTADFRKLRPERRVHGAFVTLSITRLGAGRARYSCVVSKKVAPLAVDRNLIKRRCRSAVIAARLPDAPLALVFTAKKSAQGALYKDIVKDIADLIKKLG